MRKALLGHKGARYLSCRTECTQAAWDKIGGTDSRHWNGADLPIEEVSFNACAAWCSEAGLRLPSEAEWEYACRAGTTGRFCFGDSDSDLGSYAWYKDNSNEKTHPAAQKKPNAFGLFDMHGNVWEFCRDKYVDNYDKTPRDGTAFETEGSSIRVIRSGGWGNHPRRCRSAWRAGWDDGFSYGFDVFGFRPAASLPDSR